MTVKELINKLNKFDGDAKIEIFNCDECEILQIGEIWVDDAGAITIEGE